MLPRATGKKGMFTFVCVERRAPRICADVKYVNATPGLKVLLGAGIYFNSVSKLDQAANRLLYNTAAPCVFLWEAISDEQARRADNRGVGRQEVQRHHRHHRHCCFRLPINPYCTSLYNLFSVIHLHPNQLSVNYGSLPS